MARFTKAPDSRLDFGVDWKDWLNKGDSIVDILWSCVDNTINIESSFIEGTKSMCIISGGVLGRSYNLKVAITTKRGLIDERIITIQIQNQTI